MFKKISVFLVLVLVVTTLSACASAKHGTTELTDEKKKEIERAWLIQNEKLWTWCHIPYGSRPTGNGGLYYGNYNGYDMLYYNDKPGSLGRGFRYEIAGEVFAKDAHFQLLAYRNGKFYDVEELYKKGRVSRKTIAAMAETHKKWFSNSDEDA